MINFGYTGNNMWKRLSTKIVLDHPRLHVVEDQVELPSGHITDYVRIEIKGNAPTVIAINSEQKILVQREYSYPINEVMYQFPGGFVPNAEDLEVGANRELMEESGLRAQKLQLIGSYFPNNRRANYKAYVFLGTELIEEERAGDIEEDIESLWLDESEIDARIKSGEFNNGSLLATWAIYKAYKSTPI